MIHDAGDLTELAANLHNNGLGGLLHGAHGGGGEDEGQHGAHKEAYEDGGAGEGEVQSFGGALLDDVHIGNQKGQSGEGGGADGEALAGGGGGVAQGVQRVGALADLGRQAAHLGNAACVVGHGAVGVSGQGDTQGGEHAHTGDADAVQTSVKGLGESAGGVHDLGGSAGGEVADQDGGGHNENGGHSGLKAQGDTTDDDGGGAGLGGGSQLLGGLVGVGSVVLGEITDGAAPHQTGYDGGIHAPAAHGPQGEGSGQHSRQDRGGVGADTQTLEEGLLGGILFCADEEGAQHGADDAAHGQSHGQQHTAVAVAAHCGQGEGGQDGTMPCYHLAG